VALVSCCSSAYVLQADPHGDVMSYALVTICAEAAELAGVRQMRTLISVYMLSGPEKFGAFAGCGPPNRTDRFSVSPTSGHAGKHEIHHCRGDSGGISLFGRSCLDLRATCLVRLSRLNRSAFVVLVGVVCVCGCVFARFLRLPRRADAAVDFTLSSIRRSIIASPVSVDQLDQKGVQSLTWGTAISERDANLSQNAMAVSSHSTLADFRFSTMVKLIHCR